MYFVISVRSDGYVRCPYQEYLPALGRVNVITASVSRAANSPDSRPRVHARVWLGLWRLLSGTVYGTSVCGNRSVTTKTALVSASRKRDERVRGSRPCGSAIVRGVKPRDGRAEKELGTEIAGGLCGQNEKYDKLWGMKRRYAKYPRAVLSDSINFRYGISARMEGMRRRVARVL